MADYTVSTRLVAEVGQYVGGMDRAAASTLRFGQSASGSSAKAKSGFDLASKSGLLMGAAVAGGLAMAISKSMDFEKSMSAVSAATQETGSTLKALRGAAMKAGADTAYSATEAANAITEMAKAGVSAKDIMGGGLAGALSLAAAGQIDVAEAAGIASTAMTQFSLSGADLPHVADLLAAGAGKAMGSVDDLGMALNQAGLIASASGLSIEETTGALAAFASAGLLGSDAGTSLKTMLQKLQAPSKEAAGVMSELGINVYDTNGNMLDMAGMAGQLQTHLSGLTQEQRNSALATIFGSDAVRAANVLYAQGSAGISSWTTKVNDSGYAAKQAAALQDNLAGDLEKLGGAFDTLMIGMGSGAQGPLRALVQGLANVLDGISSLGGPLKAAGGFIADNKELAIGLAAALGVQLVGGIGAVTVAFNRMVLTPVVLGLSNFLGVVLNLPGAFAAARTAVASFAAAVTPLLAIGAVALAITKVVDFATAAGNARSEISGMWDAVADSRGGAQLEALDGVVDQLRAKVAALKGDIGNTKDAIGGIGSINFLFNADDFKSLDVYEAALERATKQQEEAKRTASVMGAQFHLNADEVMNLASKYNIDLTGGVANAYRLFQNFYGAEFGSKPTEATFAVKDAMDDAKAATEDAKTALDQYKLSLDILTGAHISMAQAEAAVYNAMDQATDAVKKNGGAVLDQAGALNLQSENGRSALGTIIDYTDAANTQIATMIEQGKSATEVTKADATLRAGFIKTLATMGITGKAAEDLATKYYGIPTERKTKIEADTKAAQDKIAGVQSSIDNLHGKTVQVQVRAAGRFIVNPQGGLQEFATGGWTGPGSKYTPAGIVHADEFVVPKERVNALGGPRAVGSLVGMPGYADGGPVVPINYVVDSRPVEGAMSQVAQAMKDATPKAGALGSGSVGSGAWGAIWQYVHSRIPQARINSTYRPGDPGYHGLGKAIDFGFGSGPGGAGSAGLASINRLLYDNVGHNLAELIYDGIGDDRPDIKNGANHTYNAGTRAEHHNHVHAAVYDQGGPLYPGYTLAYNGTGKTEWVSKETSGSGGRAPVVQVAAPDLSGMRITGTLDLGNGLEGRIDGRIDAKLGEVADTVHYAGV